MKQKNTTVKLKDLRIGFDFDKVFVHHPPLIPTSFIYWIYKKKSTKLKYRFPGKLEQKVRIFSHFPLFRHPNVDNIDALKKLSKKYPLFLISGRFGFLEQRTAAWMKKFPINKYFREVHFNFDNNQPHIFKNQLIKKLKITHFIDDDFDLILFLAKHNPKVFFYWIDTNPISKKYIPFENMKRIKKISDISDL